VAIVVVLLLGIVIALIVWLGQMFFGGISSKNDVAVPSVEKLSEDEATQMIKNAGLVPEVIYRSSQDTPKGAVDRQNPEAPRNVHKGTKISLFVSTGKGRFIIPPLSGKAVDAATSELIADGLLVGDIKKVYDPGQASGTVVNQDPEPGREFATPPEVSLLVTDKEQVPNGQMPNVEGQDLASVEQLLARSKLQLSRVTYVVNDNVAAGTVTKQSIAALSEVKLGQKVELEVALSSAQAQQKNKSLNVSASIPDGPAQQELRIEVQDELGKKSSLDEQKAPHDSVNQLIAVQGSAKIMIYLRDMKTPWRTDVVPYIAPPPVEQKPAGGAPPLGGNDLPPQDNTPPPGATL
jgi:beta-lactam-binding protein with PASTA domain